MATPNSARHCCLRGFGATLLFFEVTEDCPGIDPQVASGLGAIPVVERQNLVDVIPLKFLLGLVERKDLGQVIGRETEVLGANEIAV